MLIKILDITNGLNYYDYNIPLGGIVVNNYGKR